MRQADISGIDLNLLKLFDALVQERSVTRAGLRLRLSQPAASRALGRLRTMLGDRLVVRGRSGLELTPRAEMLAGPVAKLLADARAIASPSIFSPAMAEGRISLAALDHLTFLFVPALLARFERDAPSLDIEVTPPSGDNVEVVVRNNVDLAIGVFAGLPLGLFHRKLYDDDFVCILRQGHPAVASGLPLSHYLDARHVVVSISGHGESTVDATLSARSLTRRIALRVPHFLAGAMIVADSDMVLTLPRRLANRLAATLPIAVLDLPLAVPGLAPTMIWHERVHGDPCHIWVRQQVIDVARELDACGNAG
jgi:DNA-binding transcriptional LysR family regulator